MAKKLLLDWFKQITWTNEVHPMVTVSAPFTIGHTYSLFMCLAKPAIELYYKQALEFFYRVWKHLTVSSLPVNISICTLHVPHF